MLPGNVKFGIQNLLAGRWLEVKIQPKVFILASGANPTTELVIVAHTLTDATPSSIIVSVSDPTPSHGGTLWITEHFQQGSSGGPKVLLTVILYIIVFQNSFSVVV